nr:Chain C, Neurotensin [Rattus norvegicus]3ZEV_D Chain D, Neurotensin [Rattus norvegicus]6YVR_CCC Chain CCC, neurotensin NTS8-13 (full agonist) [Rattus norvegicus]6YVR_DDD Chain DDD, neurotensin NTS8-13 (full agonist) [Rattus norvegicus]
GGRRPYIL